MTRKKKLTDKNQYYSEVQRLVNDSSGLSVLLMKEILERAGYSDRRSVSGSRSEGKNHFRRQPAGRELRNQAECEEFPARMSGWAQPRYLCQGIQDFLTDGPG